MIGKHISHYKILEKLGAGGMGVVYKAEDLKLKRLVALKFLAPEWTQNPQAKQRFIFEAQAASALEHPNICTIHEIDETEQGQLFIVMACYEGETLQQRMERGALKPEQALDITLQIAHGLTKAHQKGMVHRDLKPANVFLTNDEVVKILDFGLAKLKGVSPSTKDHSLLGTIPYMAPEQINGLTVDQRTDIWALGVILYQMLSGHLPFNGEYEAALMYAILNEEPAPLQSDLKEVEHWQYILKRCLAKDPQKRYQTLEKLIADLQAMRQHSRLTTKSQNKLKTRPRLKPLLIGGTLILLLALLVARYFHWFQSHIVTRVPIAVIDFKNETNEPALDGLSGMLITALEQSQRLQVLTRSRLFDILRQAGFSNTSHIDESLGRKICQMADIRTLALAVVRKFGNLYVIDLKILNVQKNEYLFTAKVQGSGLEAIPTLIDQLAEKTRNALQEKSAEILASSRSVAQLTTPNLEAYYHYFKGQEYIDKLEFRAARKAFERAIALDSTFGLAYYRLAYVIGWVAGSEQACLDYINKAIHYLQRIPPKERYLVRAVQAQLTEGFQAGIKILKEMEQYYPNDKEMLYNLGDWSYHAFLLNQAKTYLLRVYQLDSLNLRTLEHLTWTYRDLGEISAMRNMAWRYFSLAPGEESSALLAESLVSEFGPQLGWNHFLQTIKGRAQTSDYALVKAFLLMYKDRYVQADSLLQFLIRSKQGLSIAARRILIKSYLYQGRYRAALQQIDILIIHYQQQQNKTQVAFLKVSKPLLQWDGWHNIDQSWTKASETLAEAKQVVYGYFWAALSLLAVEKGLYDQARSFGRRLGMEFWDRALEILILLHRKQLRPAVTLSRSLLKDRKNFMVCLLLFPTGKLQLEQNAFNQAQESFLRVRTVNDNRFYFRPVCYPKTYYWQGRIAEAQGDFEQAQKFYEHFLHLWKQADPDLPEFKDARQRLKHLSKKD